MYKENLKEQQKYSYEKSIPISVSKETWDCLTSSFSTSNNDRYKAGIKEEFCKLKRMSEKIGYDSCYNPVSVIKITNFGNVNQLTIVSHKTGYIWCYSEGNYPEDIVENLVKNLVVDQETIIAKKTFAQNCTKVSRQTGISFEICLAFKGNLKEIQIFKESIKKAVKSPLNNEDIQYELILGRNRNAAALDKLEIKYGLVDTNRIAFYVYECLTKK